MKKKRQVRARRRKRATMTNRYEQIWWEALHDLRHQLAAECRISQPDRLRFQTGRLFANLISRIEATRGNKATTAQRCYIVATDQPFSFAYYEPRRLHLEEMNALFSSYPAVVKSKHPHPIDTGSAGKLISTVPALRHFLRVNAVVLLLQSIASWIEAQESLSIWVELKKRTDYWQTNDPDADQNMQAAMLSRFPTFAIPTQFRGKRLLGVNRNGVAWSPTEWARILKRAARLAEANSFTELEQWVWWRHPVFSRYGWSAHEVMNLAKQSGLLGRSPAGDERHFRRYWITRGLRFRGRRRTKEDKPPLAEFVRKIVIPDSKSLQGLPWPLPNSLRK